MPLRNISLVLSILGALALAVSLIAAIMQRARRVATLRAIGMQDRQVLAYLATELAVITLAGVLAGLVGGLVAHRMVIDYLAGVRGYPAEYSIEPGVLGLAVGLAVTASLVMPLLSLWWLAKVPVRNSFGNA